MVLLWVSWCSALLMPWSLNEGRWAWPVRVRLADARRVPPPRSAQRRQAGIVLVGQAQVEDALLQPRGVGLHVELDHQAQVVGRVGMGQGVLVADLAGLVETEQRLVEGLHALLGGALHQRLELVDLALAD